jgi:hypothetical protein
MIPTLFAYMPHADAVALCKLAEEAQPRSTSNMIREMLGMGIGSLAGVGAAHGANALYKHLQGKDIPIPHLMTAAPIVGAGLGLAYNLAKARELEETRRGLEGTHDQSERRVP